ncbi:MAG: DNA mismatch repair protein MutS [Xanthobacteraceae bacterium]
MKAFLMYPDRDFDRQQLLARRERELNPRTADQALDLRQLLPPNEAALTQDLGLDILLDAMALGDNFLFEVAKVAVLSGVDDPQVILYRQRILRDCLQHEAIVRRLYEIAIEAITEERKNYWSSFGRYPAGTLHRAVDVLQMFVGKLRRLRRIADEYAEHFQSDGFVRLFAMLRAELDDDYFALLEDHLRRLKFRGGVLISARLGKGNKGTHYLLRKPHGDKRNWIVRLLQRPPGYTFQLHPRDEGGARALSELRDQGVNLVANALAQSTDHISSFFQMLRIELAFYIGCLNLRRKLVDLQEPTCFPLPMPHGERKLSFSELYDCCLALSMKRKVVGNDLNADGKDLVVITGANTGGKSTFMRSLGLGQLMMQAGMFVAAETFAAEVRDGLFTHYRREEDTAMESGKLDEELSRMSEIVDRLSPRSMMLFNESFAATNEREGSEIATQITKALLECGVKVLFVTHLHEFARGLYDDKTPNAAFLRAERLPDATRTFRLIEGEPLQTSYGNDLYDAVFGAEHPPPVEKRRLSVAG